MRSDHTLHVSECIAIDRGSKDIYGSSDPVHIFRIHVCMVVVGGSSNIDVKAEFPFIILFHASIIVSRKCYSVDCEPASSTSYFSTYASLWMGAATTLMSKSILLTKHLSRPASPQVVEAETKASRTHLYFSYFQMHRGGWR